MKMYAVKVKHDKGCTTFVTPARNAETARQIVMACEGCPARAIVRVRHVRKNA
jgi:hypothetical protein